MRNDRPAFHIPKSTFLIVRRAFIACVLAAGIAAQSIRAASDAVGQVTFSGIPVPGATVTATRDDATRATVTDQQGVYRFADLADGRWTVRVEMLGFAPLTQDVTIPTSEPAMLSLTLLRFEQIAPNQPPPVGVRPTAPAAQAAPAGGAPAPTAAGSPGGFQRATVNPAAGAAPAARIAEPARGGDDDRSNDAADGFLINGSVNNGAASPFAQLRAFGNNRRNARSLYNGGIGIVLGNSAWDSRPFSFAGQETPKPSYTDMQILGSFAGPIRIPHVLRNGPNLFLGFQHTADHNATTESALVPTAAERAGDLSRTLDGFGRPVRVVDPVTGLPFAGNQIPSSRLSPQAAALLGLYPTPNVDGSGRYNYQTSVLSTVRQDAVQARLTETLNPRNQLFGTISVQRTTTESANLFGFADKSRVSGIDAPVNWSHRFSQFFSLRLRAQYTALSTHVTPYFANRENVSGNAGIIGNNQDPVNWGPPALQFSSGYASLSSLQYASNDDRTLGWGAETLWNHGRHNITAGGDVKRRRLDVFSQQNARGTFAFTGGASGFDLGDFLLGLPHSSTIAFGNPDKNLRQTIADAYVTDDLRLNATFTANIGVRWEFESPFREAQGRLVNLDVVPGFAAASPVLATDPVGSLTDQQLPAALIRSDFSGVQPRLGIAWRPIAGSSLVIRAGYGVYRNASGYQPIAMLLAQQPPLSKALTLETNPAAPLTLANGFVAPPGVQPNTFAVDPDFRVGFAQNWQALVQRDLPASLTVTATYLGTKGSRLMQEFLPNTYPLGAANPCPTCPIGFAYLTSTGSSSRHAGQFQLRRRLRNGFTATAQYTFAKATDDATAFTGASLNGASIAQDWRHLDAELAPSNFDQRHLLTAQFQYTSGVGMGGGALLDGARGSLLKGWTVTGQLTAGSSLPLTPIVLTSVPGTGVTGTIRPDVANGSQDAPEGYYLNPSAFATPASGRWGAAGRNSLRGPAQFSFNSSLGRSFLWGDRLSVDWRIDANNIFNRVTYSGVNTIVGSPQFGLANQANTMRKLQSSLRFRF